MNNWIETAVVALVLVLALAYLLRSAWRKWKSPICGDGCGCSSKLLKK